MLQTKPYFLTNKEWYYHDDKKNKYFLTNKAPKKAVESYNKFYEVRHDSYELSILELAKQRLIDNLKKQGKSEEEVQKEVLEWENGKSGD